MDDQARPTSASLDVAAWDLIVDMVIPVAWDAAMVDGRSERDAADVCSATLLALVDRLRLQAAGRSKLRGPLRTLVHDLAVVECTRIRRLRERRTIDLREKQPEMTRSESHGD